MMIKGVVSTPSVTGPTVWPKLPAVFFTHFPKRSYHGGVEGLGTGIGGGGMGTPGGRRLVHGAAPTQNPV